MNSASTIIIDYGMGNLRSVQKAFERIGEPAVVSSSPSEIANAERVVLPGVGAFRDAIAALRRHDLVNVITDHIAADRPFLGICLGLQLLMDVSLEDGEHEGLGIIAGQVRHFDLPREFKVPHMGWNQLTIRSSNPLMDDGLPVRRSLESSTASVRHSRERGNSAIDIDAMPDLLANLGPSPWFYFVHSYHVVPDDSSWIAATADYGGPFTAVVARGNVMATQFHPEKSQSTGKQLLQNFVDCTATIAG